MVAMSTYRLSITPDELRGRASSAVGTLVTGALSIGTMLGGVLLTVIGPREMVLLSSAWLALLAVVTMSNRTVRQAPIAAEASSGPAAQPEEPAATVPPNEP
jgi:MFS family permease